MTLLGTVVLDVVGLLLVVWVLNLVRLNRLYVGYGIVLLFAIVGTMGVASVPPARAAVGEALRALFPGAELIVVVSVAFVLILIYTLAQVTRIANRLAALVQELALSDVERPGDRPPQAWSSSDVSERGSGRARSRPS
jgi:hypothetical protein